MLGRTTLYLTAESLHLPPSSTSLWGLGAHESAPAGLLVHEALGRRTGAPVHWLGVLG